MEQGPRNYSFRERLMFIRHHRASPEFVDEIRSILLEEKKLINEMLEDDDILEKNLYEVRNDKPTQDSYKRLMLEINVLGETSEAVMAKVAELPPKILAGWFIFKKAYYEQRFRIKID